MFQKNAVNAILLLGLCAVGIFGPEIQPFQGDDENARNLAGLDHDRKQEKNSSKVERSVFTRPPPPSGVEFACPFGEGQFPVDWKDVRYLKNNVFKQTILFPTGLTAIMTVVSTAPAMLQNHGRGSGTLFLGANTEFRGNDILNTTGGNNPPFPDGYVTLTLEFDRELTGLYMSVGNVKTDGWTADAVRIRMYNSTFEAVPMIVVGTGTVRVKQNYGFQDLPDQGQSEDGFNASLYAKPLGSIQVIAIDLSAYHFREDKIGTRSSGRYVYPALDFRYCAPAQFIPVPTVNGTNGAMSRRGLAGAPWSYSSAGVNGDPLIMGLSGQLFHFDGRSGAWYSAISTPSFQWNMLIQSYDDCSEQINSYVGGAGFTFFKKGKVTKRIEVNVANAYSVDVGCGSNANNAHCLGAGSLELVIDGKKHTVGGDYTTDDGTARIIAFNTLYECSRKWYDFDVRPSEDSSSMSLRNGRRLAHDKDVFEIISGLKDTMIDREVCEQWLSDRKRWGDIFAQPGHHSTILIHTDEITFHLEYKQEHERCQAHSIDVWISSVSPALLAEKWEGIIGETLDPLYVSDGTQTMIDRAGALKFADDLPYEVNSPFATTCQGCHQKQSGIL